jgi:hypothetical protein
MMSIEGRFSTCELSYVLLSTISTYVLTAESEALVVAVERLGSVFHREAAVVSDRLNTSRQSQRLPG